MKRALNVLGLTLELAALGALLWRQLNPEAPGLSELAGAAWKQTRERAQYREAIRRTLASIRDLPEEPEP